MADKTVQRRLAAILAADVVELSSRPQATARWSNLPVSSMPSAATSRWTFAISVLVRWFAPMMLKAPQVSMQAIGLRLDTADCAR
jgi:hypothetical protein